jgi:hypothetical protein
MISMAPGIVFVASPWLGKRRETYYLVGIVAGLLAGLFLVYRLVPNEFKYVWLAVSAAFHGKVSMAVWYDRTWPFSWDALVAYVLGAAVLGMSAAHLLLGEIDVKTHRIGDVVGWLIAFVAGTVLVFSVQDPIERSAVFSVLCVVYLTTVVFDKFWVNAAEAKRTIEEQERADWGTPLPDTNTRREYLSVEEYQRLGDDTTNRAVGLLVDDPRFRGWVRDNHRRIYVAKPPADERPMWRNLFTISVVGAGVALYTALVRRS